MLMEFNDFEYFWDNDYDLNRKLINIDSLDEIKKYKINGINAQELLNKQKIDFKVVNGQKFISKDLYDKYGEIHIDYNDETIRKIRITPWKLSKGLKTPKEVYEFVSDDIFQDINSFLSYVIRNLRKNIKSVDSFSYHFLEEFPKSYDFLVNLLDYNSKLLEDNLLKLYHNGPIHKEITLNQDYSGSQLVLTSLINSPYPSYIKKQHSHNTLLNHMMFQSSYCMMFASKLIESRLKDENKHLKTSTKRIFHTSQKQLNEYNLWTFHNLEVLDDSEIRSKLLSQNNPYYIGIYKVFRIVKDIIIYLTLIAALRLDEGIEMALRKFYGIYEIWAIATLLKTYQKSGFELENVELDSFNSISAKMILILRNKDVKIKIFWEIRLDPVTHSTYYGGLIDENNNINLKPIKPDIIIIMESDKSKKVFIGDVKFIIKKKSHLPKLDSFYKVLSYMEDLKRSPLFQGAEVAGLLIYPGNTSSSITPIKNENYINVIPLNLCTQDFKKIIEV